MLSVLWRSVGFVGADAGFRGRTYKAMEFWQVFKAGIIIAL
jgi:hypothetical protein